MGFRLRLLYLNCGCFPYRLPGAIPTDMQRSYFLLFPLFFAIHHCVAQTVENKAAATEIDSLLNVARQNDTDFDKAMDDVLAARTKALTAFGDRTSQYAACRFQQGRILYRQGKYEEAIQACLDAMGIQADVLGKEHPDYVQSLTTLGEIYLNVGDFANAEAHLMEAQSTSQHTGRTQDNVYATLLTSLGNYYRVTGDLAKAEECYLECVRIREQVFGKASKYYGSALHNAALIYLKKGEYEKAEKLFRQTQAIFAQTIGVNSDNYSTCIQNLASVYRATGDFEQAEKLSLEALDIAANTLGKDHADYAINLDHIANLYMDMGNFEKAHAYYLESKNLREATLGKDHYYYALSLNNLGSYYRAVHDFGQAEQLYAAALAICEKSLGDEHYYTILAKDNLAWTYREQGKYGAAEPLIQEVIKVREKYQGSEHPDLARSLVNLAFLQKHLGKYGEAEKLYRRAGQIWQKTAGPESLDYLATIQELADIQALTRRPGEALHTMAEAGRLQKMAYFRASRHMTENELAAYIDRFSNYFDRHFSFLQNMHPAPGEATAQAFDDAIFYKGYVLDQAGRVKKFTIQDPGFAAQYQRLDTLQTNLAGEYAKPPAQRDDIAAMEEEINTIEKTLVASVAGYGERFKQLTWQDIQRTLQPGEAVVEFVHFDSLADNLENIQYAALVLPASQGYPVFVPLCTENDLAKLMEAPNENRIEVINRLYSFDEKHPGKSLHHLLWQPLEGILSGVKTVYFSPTGLLYRLNPGAIQGEHGTVLADRFQWVELGSTRQLALPHPALTGTGSAALFGGIEYDIEPTSNAAQTTTLDLAGRNITSSDSTENRLRGENWGYLNWTKTEVETISLVAEEAGVPTAIFSGSDGSEEAFKKLGSERPSPRILHLATHGYFFPDPKTMQENDEPDETGFEISEQPMIRSGLILAGGNYAWKNGKPIRPGMDDGILTAYEIAQLDLSETELVVLSACETGLGDIRGNEGVYGLQRAFKFAGAKYLLMSLWQVPDFQTQELMTAFYYHYLSEKMDISTAFRAAQAELRQKYPDPFLWAGFVLVE